MGIWSDAAALEMANAELSGRREDPIIVSVMQIRVMSLSERNFVHCWCVSASNWLNLA